MRNVDRPAVRLVDEVDEKAIEGLTGEVKLALVGIAEAAREGLLARGVTAGMAILGEMLELGRVA